MFQITLIAISAIMLGLGMFGIWAAWHCAAFITLQSAELQRMVRSCQSGAWTPDALRVHASLVKERENLDFNRGTGVILCLSGIIFLLFAI